MLRLKSGEVRRVRASCRAVIGVIGHGEYFLRKIGKAGAMRWCGCRPHVRAMVMNPVDHPMGGGEGRSKSTRFPSVLGGSRAKDIARAIISVRINGLFLVGAHGKGVRLMARSLKKGVMVDHHLLVKVCGRKSRVTVGRLKLGRVAPWLRRILSV